MKENQNIEWKEIWKDEYLKWICGYANAQGGSIYIGMSDEGEILGVDHVENLLDILPNKIMDALGIVCDINEIKKGEHSVIEIDVALSHFLLIIMGNISIEVGRRNKHFVDRH